MNEEPPVMISLPRLAQKLGVDRRTLRKRCAQGVIRCAAIDPDRGVLFRADQLKEIAEALFDTMDRNLVRLADTFGAPVMA